MVKIGNVYVELGAVEAIVPARNDHGHEIILTSGRSIIVDNVTEKDLMDAFFREGYLIASDGESEKVSLTDCFTPAELKELAGVWSLGFRFVAKEASGWVFAYVSEPHKGRASWINDDSVSAVTRLRAGSYDALSFEDVVPLHIGVIMEEMGS